MVLENLGSVNRRARVIRGLPTDTACVSLEDLDSLLPAEDDV